MRVLWTARRSNQSTLKEFKLEYSLEELMLKLKLQYFGHLIHSADSLEKTLMLGKIKGRRRSLQRMRWLDSLNDSVDMNLSKHREIERTGEPGMLKSMGTKGVGHVLETEGEWTVLNTFHALVNPHYNSDVGPYVAVLQVKTQEPRKVK